MSVTRAAVFAVSMTCLMAATASAQSAAQSPSVSKPDAVSFARPVLLGAIKAYQRVATSRAGMCPMWPSCSRFAYEAFSTHPPLTAFFLTADRLHRCGHDMKRYRLSPEEPYKLHDPVPTRVRAHAERTADVDEEWPAMRAALARHDDFGEIAVNRISDWLMPSHDPQVQAPPAIQSGDPDSAQRQIRFANELRSQGAFEEAIVEYRRFLSFYPDSPERSRVALALFGAYRQSGQHQDAARWGEKLTQDTAYAAVVNDELKLTIGHDWMFLGNQRLARSFFEQVKDSTNLESRQRAQLMEGFSFAREGAWTEAEQTFLRNLPAVSDGSAFSNRARALAALAAEGGKLPRKNPTVAGLLSIVPGLGYLYDGYPGTALSSALVNGLFMGATYKAFKDGNKPLGVTLSVLSLGWYGGNVTGSIATAHRRNAAMRDEHVLKFSLGFRY